MRSTKLSGASHTGWYLDDPTTVATINLADIDPVRLDGSDYLHGMAISTDGTKLFIGIQDPDAMLEFTLTTPGDITTILGTYVEKAMPDLPSNPYWFRFNNEGTVLFTSNQTGTGDDNYLYQYNLSSAWDVTTLIYIKKYKYNVGNFTYQTRSVDVSADGMKLYLTLYDSVAAEGYLREYTLGSSWDLGNVVLANSIFLPQGNASNNNLFAKDGLEVTGIIQGDFNRRLLFAEPFDISSTMTIDPNEYVLSTIAPLYMCSTYSNATLYTMDGIGDSLMQQISLRPENFITPPETFVYRYWGFVTPSGAVMDISQVEMLEFLGAQSVSQCDTLSHIKGITSFGDKTNTKYTDEDLLSFVGTQPDSEINFDCGSDVTVSYVRFANDVAEAGWSVRIRKSVNGTTWRESSIIALSYSGDNVFSDENYIDIANLTWS